MPTNTEKAVRYYRRASWAHQQAKVAIDEHEKELHCRVRDQLLHLGRTSQEADQIENLYGPPADLERWGK